MILTDDELAAIERQAAAEYPAECCGVVVVRGHERRVFPCRNVQDELHRKDPARYTRTSRTGYNAHHEDLIAIDRLERQGFAIAVIYHSHIDAGAYFSGTDKQQAMGGQDPRTHEPSYPHTTYVVVSVVGGQVAAQAAFRWDAARRDFIPVELDVSASGPVSS
ncbi:MAG: Mov34/MPN/PAD-1 family protein [Candidatus Rokuibacteriota bacterium]